MYLAQDVRVAAFQANLVPDASTLFHRIKYFRRYRRGNNAIIGAPGNTGKSLAYFLKHFDTVGAVVKQIIVKPVKIADAVITVQPLHLIDYPAARTDPYAFPVKIPHTAKTTVGAAPSPGKNRRKGNIKTIHP